MTKKEEYSSLIRSLQELPENLRCDGCRTKKSDIWYACSKLGCDLIYCQKQGCNKDRAKEHHENLDEEEGEVPHKYQRTPVRMQLNLDLENEKINVKEIMKTEKKLGNMSISEKYGTGRHIISTTTMVLGQSISTLSKIPLTECSGGFAKFLVKTSSKISGGSCGAITAIGASIDLGVTCYRYFSGEIKEFSEFGKEILQKGIKHAVTFGTVYGSTKLFMSAGVAFGGPIGAVIGGVIGAGVGYFIQKGFDKYWPRNDEKNEATQKIVIEALKRFHFKPNDIHNPEVFNKLVIQKRYKAYAKECHPDSKNGRKLDDAKERFIELNAHFGVLMGMVDRLRGNSKTEDKKVFKKQLSIMFQKW